MNDYRVTLAAPEHVDALPSVELAAAARFAKLNVPSIVFSEATSTAVLSAAQVDGLLWVALAPGGEAIGFALASRSGERVYLEELDVTPEHGGRGLGVALMTEVERWAQAHACTEIALTTYRDVPWNGPFYLRHGFGFVDDPDGELSTRLRGEQSRGLAAMPRIAMIRRVSRTTGESSRQAAKV